MWVLGFARIMRIVLMFRRNCQRCQLCLRYLTGANKARLVDPINDIDLDLVYITPRLIGMSVPANGWITSLYRNSLSEVVEFFEKHHAGHYLIVNVCPELPYPSERFRTGRVLRYNVPDHMPPQIRQLIHFLGKVNEFLNEDPNNVVAVHCKGGKGRTGVFCSCWLLYDWGQTNSSFDADAAMAAFAYQRTDINPRTGDGRLQGVETPSQVRFCREFEKLVRSQSAFRPHAATLPFRSPLRLCALTAVGVFLSPPGALEAIVQRGRRITFCSQPCPANADVDKMWDLEDVGVTEEFRISVAKPGYAQAWPNATLEGREPGCLFFFIAHTAWVGSNEWRLPVSEVDRACKDRKRFNQSGYLILTFTRP